jgi:hypothetical protein
MCGGGGRRAQRRMEGRVLPWSIRAGARQAQVNLSANLYKLSSKQSRYPRTPRSPVSSRRSCEMVCTCKVTVRLSSFSKKLDVWSQHAHRAPNRCGPRYASMVLHVCTVTCTQFYPRVLHWKNIYTQFSPRVLILASVIYSILPSSGWSTESQQMGLSYLIESFHAQKNLKK